MTEKLNLAVVDSFEQLSAEQRQIVLRILADEFYSHRPDLDGAQVFEEAFSSGKERAIALLNDDQPIGVLTYKDYDFHKIARQLFLQAQYGDEGQATHLRFKPFEELLELNGYTDQYLKAVEIAYLVLLNEFRGQKISSVMVVKLIESLLVQYPNAIFFAIARGVYAQLNITAALTTALLEAEEAANGTGSDGKPIVTGVWTDVERLSQKVGQDLSRLNPDFGSPQSIHNMKKAAGKPIGFAKNTSPTWATIREGMGLLLGGKDK